MGSMAAPLPPTDSPPPEGETARLRARGRWIRLPRNSKRRALFISVYLLFCGGLLYGASALYWNWRAGVPLTGRATVWDFFYPEIRRSGLLETATSHDDRFFDVVLLGGSVLEPYWGDVERCLREKLSDLCGDEYRLFNLAGSAQTSRDSRTKYAHLADKQFDVVVVYDGINDVRMNNCSAEMFREDYTHCAWYRSFERYLAAGSMSLGAAVGQQLETLGEAIDRGGPVDDAHAEAGREIKTAGPLRDNLAEILRLAGERNDTVLLMTYAYYLPPNYTSERFKAHELDYTYLPDARSCDAAMWSKPEYLGPTIDAQNAEIRKLAAAHPETPFVDMQASLPARGENFVDPCHLTPAGSRLFVEALWPAVVRAHTAWKERGGRAVPDR